MPSTIVYSYSVTESFSQAELKLRRLSGVNC